MPAPEVSFESGSKSFRLRLDLAALYRFEKNTGINLLANPEALAQPSFGLLLEFAAACAGHGVTPEQIGEALAPEDVPTLLQALERLWKEAAPASEDNDAQKGGTPLAAKGGGTSGRKR
jgi:hypothetical protein